MDFERWIIATCAALALACVGLVIWVALSGGLSCPKGQQAVVTSYIPITSYIYGSNMSITGSYVILSPVYACEVTNG